MSLDIQEDEVEAAGLKAPLPGFWIWVMCWPLALWVTIITAYQNAKTGPDGS